jgi:hypothetical protein
VITVSRGNAVERAAETGNDVVGDLKIEVRVILHKLSGLQKGRDQGGQKEKRNGQNYYRGMTGMVTS